MNIFTPSTDKLRITLLVLPDSSMMSLASALDTMRAANRIASRDLFEWKIATLSGKTARLTSGLMIDPDTTLNAQSSGDVLIIIASFYQQYHAGPAHLKLIKRLARNFAAVGGIETGSWILARSGLLEGRAATTHWEDLEEFTTHFPGVEVKADRFVIDGPVFTTGGASPTFDFISPSSSMFRASRSACWARRSLVLASRPSRVRSSVSDRLRPPRVLRFFASPRRCMSSRRWTSRSG